MANLIGDFPANLPEEVVEVLAEHKHVRIERIVSTGHASSEGFWYDQDAHEWVVVLKGEAELLFENGETFKMKPGDHVLLPAHTKYRVAASTNWPRMTSGVQSGWWQFRHRTSFLKR